MIDFLQWRAGQLSGQTLSAVPSSPGWTSFNGGPDSCPAKPARNTPQSWSPAALQWRAGQLSGQTRSPPPPPPPSTTLQWRAGQLSGQTRIALWLGDRRPATFNGGPDSCPAKRDGHLDHARAQLDLQWRAGQLSGQTRPPAPPPLAIPVLQWRAGQLSGQTVELTDEEGGKCALQWRAGQLSGQT